MHTKGTGRGKLLSQSSPYKRRICFLSRVLGCDGASKEFRMCMLSNHTFFDGNHTFFECGKLVDERGRLQEDVERVIRKDSDISRGT